jgi:hypothetical protein
MIVTPTVLVLGAGASKPFGFPLGSELRSKIIQANEVPPRLSVLLQTVVQNGYDSALAAAFADTLRKSGSASVDALLEHRPDFAEIGKAAISAALIPLEREWNLFDPNASAQSWYDYLFHAMNAPKLRWHYNQLSVVTFNYDRSLEFYLFTALRNLYNISAEEAAEYVRSIPIVHVHGKLGALREMYGTGRPYDTEISRETIATSVQAIRVVHEDLGDSEEFKDAKRVLMGAKRVLFLGFGYDPTSVKRLEPLAIPQSAAIFGSTNGLTNAERHSVKELFGQRLTTEDSGLEVLPFLRSLAILDR